MLENKVVCILILISILMYVVVPGAHKTRVAPLALHPRLAARDSEQGLGAELGVVGRGQIKALREALALPLIGLWRSIALLEIHCGTAAFKALWVALFEIDCGKAEHKALEESPAQSRLVLWLRSRRGAIHP